MTNIFMFSELEKDSIVYAYTDMNMSQAEISRQYHCSRNTIHRVLEEKDALDKRMTLTRKERLMVHSIRNRKLTPMQFLYALRLYDASVNYETKRSNPNELSQKSA